MVLASAFRQENINKYIKDIQIEKENSNCFFYKLNIPLLMGKEQVFVKNPNNIHFSSAKQLEIEHEKQ